VSLEDFSWQMNYLVKNFQVISINQMFEMLKDNRTLSKKVIAISFDDGFQDFYTYGFPILRKNNITATVFLPTGSIDASLPYPNKLPQSDFLTWNQIRELHQKGIDFGSHTVSHESLTKLTPQRIKSELENSKTRIETELGVEVRGFAYPYGTFRDIDPSIEGIIASSGYSWAVTSVSGINKQASNPFALRRTVIVGVDSRSGFKRAIMGALDPWVVIQKFGYYVNKIKMSSRRQLGDSS